MIIKTAKGLVKVYSRMMVSGQCYCIAIDAKGNVVPTPIEFSHYTEHSKDPRDQMFFRQTPEVLQSRREVFPRDLQSELMIMMRGANAYSFRLHETERPLEPPALDPVTDHYRNAARQHAPRPFFEPASQWRRRNNNW
jgi:hypothetical protein